MKHLLLIGSMVVGLSNAVHAQGIDVHTCYGPSGTGIELTSDGKPFNYDATITGGTAAYVATLDVFHNGVRKGSYVQVVVAPPAEGYRFSTPVDMSGWGLRPGDSVTFRLSVTGLTFGKIMAVHTLFGTVALPEKQTTY